MTTNELRQTVEGFQVGAITNWSNRLDFGTAVVGCGATRSPGIDLRWEDFRRVEVDPDDNGVCEITDRRAPQSLRQKLVDGVIVVMDVVSTPNGLKAAAWGIAPD